MTIVTKRSNAPVFWLLFGAGGMLSALLGPALVFITGIAVPLGIIFVPDLMNYANMQVFARNWAGKALVFAVISLFLWHAVHRIFHSLHDLGVHPGLGAKLACYGPALLGTLIAGYVLIAVGF
jgi:fumarate reductase subunit D